MLRSWAKAFYSKNNALRAGSLFSCQSPHRLASVADSSRLALPCSCRTARLLTRRLGMEGVWGGMNDRKAKGENGNWNGFNVFFFFSCAKRNTVRLYLPVVRFSYWLLQASHCAAVDKFHTAQKSFKDIIFISYSTGNHTELKTVRMMKTPRLVLLFSVATFSCLYVSLSNIVNEEAKFLANTQTRWNRAWSVVGRRTTFSHAVDVES